MGLDSELRISPRPVLAALLVLAIFLFLATQFYALPDEVTDPVMTLLLLVAGLTVVGWLLTGWNELAGRWFAVGALLAAIHLAQTLLNMPTATILAAVPVATAAALIGFPASLAVAVGETALLATLSSDRLAALTASDSLIAIVGVWAAIGVTYGSHLRVRHLSDWVKEYFDRAQRFLEEARDR